jgi:hypothetical protein
MKLDTKAIAAAAAITWGGCFFIVGLANLVWPPYGEAWLQLGQSLYPGYGGPAGIGSVIVVTLYALLDGAVVGAVFAWLHNRFAAGSGAASAT